MTLDGYHFVGIYPLAYSEMRMHPLTSMTESSLLRILRRQANCEVGLIPYSTVLLGSSAIRRRIESLQDGGRTIAVVDAIDNRDIRSIGEASTDMPLVTGASGLALMLPQGVRGRSADTTTSAHCSPLHSGSGLQVVLSGSCSRLSAAQVKAMALTCPSARIDPYQLAAGKDVAASILEWAATAQRRGERQILIHSSVHPNTLTEIQNTLGAREAAALVETTFSTIAVGLVRLGVRAIVVAGGETSGAVAEALHVGVLRLGPAIEDGISWMLVREPFGGEDQLTLAFKPGNFGAPDFFLRALDGLDRQR